MHEALNETLAALPDDTKVYVCILYSQYLPGEYQLTYIARPRVHKRKRQVLHGSLPIRADQETAGICGAEPADTGQIRHW